MDTSHLEYSFLNPLKFRIKVRLFEKKKYLLILYSPPSILFYVGGGLNSLKLEITILYFR